MKIKGINGRTIDGDELVVVRDNHTGRPVTMKASEVVKRNEGSLDDTEPTEAASTSEDTTRPDEDII